METIKFKNDGGQLSVGFHVLNDCVVKNYSMELYGKEGNTVIAILTKENSKLSGIRFPLPSHAFQNHLRVLTCTVKFGKNENTANEFNVGVSVNQDGHELNLIKKTGEVYVNGQSETIFIRLEGE